MKLYESTAPPPPTPPPPNTGNKTKGMNGYRGSLINNQNLILIYEGKMEILLSWFGVEMVLLLP